MASAEIFVLRLPFSRFTRLAVTDNHVTDFLPRCQLLWLVKDGLRVSQSTSHHRVREAHLSFSKKPPETLETLGSLLKQIVVLYHVTAGIHLPLSIMFSPLRPLLPLLS